MSRLKELLRDTISITHVHLEKAVYLESCLGKNIMVTLDNQKEYLYKFNKYCPSLGYQYILDETEYLKKYLSGCTKFKKMKEGKKKDTLGDRLDYYWNRLTTKEQKRCPNLIAY